MQVGRVKYYWIQVLKRAAWIFFWMMCAVIVLFGRTANFSGFDYPRIFGFSIIISAIVQSFKDRKQSQPPNGKSAYQVKYSKLLNMVGGNQATADRLISAYGIDKAISDLERDRR